MRLAARTGRTGQEVPPSVGTTCRQSRYQRHGHHGTRDMAITVPETRPSRYQRHGHHGTRDTAITVPETWPSRYQRHGHHGTRDTAITVPETWPSRYQRHGHHGTRDTAITVPETRPSRYQRHGHHGTRGTAITVVVARRSASCLVRRDLAWPLPLSLGAAHAPGWLLPFRRATCYPRVLAATIWGNLLQLSTAQRLLTSLWTCWPVDVP